MGHSLGLPELTSLRWRASFRPGVGTVSSTPDPAALAPARPGTAEHDEFDVFGELGAPTSTVQPQNSREGKVSEGEEHREILQPSDRPHR